ncbi:ATP-binding cassette, subfamily B, MsbA [Tenacibaculum mesophilum]|uniref:ABC transporter ATP-binding protein n=1 Tax=Tenacibaculum mesophilum TaxID=104268 RepID=A0ABN5T375_9FLAO|nr:ABC transporter ATP-binding protein [Tenacibaculum mesophilum]GFD92926.1 antibiotic ABC transporter ATP-binding protein [Alteromonas sp. KUL154]GFD99179.1 antibiotic ABC transporter ATP-binding protein [Alteromonas sp. KUL156]AZJ31617.1 ABC transporter ATP-binding protein [Tenacibaculum mesophilum]KAF9657714.1 ABC transporter ATP-binding protein [Tenacibaculum mesophilum]QFS29665.1 ATP-binding cassette domain-containing protein [Tenacibaculum mesophilum]
MDYFKKIIKYAIPYKKYGYLNVLFNILYALFSTLSFLVLMPMLEVIFKPNTIKVTEKPVFESVTKIIDYFKANVSYYVYEIAGDDKSKTLMVVVGLVITTFFFKNIFNYLAMYFITFLRNGVLKDIRNDLYRKTIELPISYFSEKRKGDTMARIGTDVLEIQHSFLSILEMLVREPLTIIFTITAMIAISFKLTLFVFVFIPISGYVISLIGKSLKRKSDSVQKEQGYFLSLLEETLGGLKVIKGFTAEKEFQQKFEKSTNRFYHFSNTLLNRTNLASPASEFLGIGVIAVLLWYGGILVLEEGTLQGEDFIAYMGLAYNILTPAKAISKASYGVKKGNAAAERILEVLETSNPLKDIHNAVDKKTFDTKIVIENVSFKYENEYVLKDFSLTIPKGKMIALVGQSGSGKSTIANLLTRFYDVNKGTILLDGIDIRNLKKQSLRQLEGLVTQDSILFNDTVKNNITLGVEGKSNEEIIEAAKIANAHEFIKDLPNGYDTNIGDSGNKLSGGQKQRLSIARAVLKNPPIMILDEATSALDTESEKLVQDALEKMMQNRTSVVIAHRLSTIQKADMIVVMKKGKIVEQGTHEELISKSGTYKKLVEMQSLG